MEVLHWLSEPTALQEPTAPDRTCKEMCDYARTGIAGIMLTWHGDSVLKRIEAQAGDIKGRLAGSIADRARSLCPVKTGALRRSIKADKDTVEVSEDYAALVELGTAKRAARPFVRPAIEQSNENDINLI